MSERSMGAGLLKGNSPISLFRKAWGVIEARYRLRKFSRLGKRPRITGKPRVINMGWMDMGDRGIIFSHIVQSELVSHPEGRLEIGDGVFINYGASISAHNLVRIGSGTQIAQYAVIMDNDYHRVGNLSEASESKPIIFGKNVWLGVRVVVLKGVTIGDNSVIGAGSVVTKSIPPNCLAGGVPAKVIKCFDPEESDDTKSIEREPAVVGSVS